MPSNRKFLPGYTFAIPEEFKESMHFARFYPGDIFYDHPDAYSGTWRESLQAVRHAVQIVEVYGLKVKFRVLATNPEKTEMQIKAELMTSGEEIVALLTHGYKEKGA